MPGQALTVTDNLDGLAAGLRSSGEALADLDSPNRRAADVVLGGVNAPTRTKALAATVDAEVTSLGFTLIAGSPRVDYAGFVHRGTRHMRARPFLTDALTAREEAVVDIYADHADQALGLIPGA